MAPSRPTALRGGAWRRSAGAAGATLAVALLLGACGAENPSAPVPGTPSPKTDPAATPSSPVGGGSPSSTTSAVPRFNPADIRFAQGMIPHHRQAVQMSEMLLAKPEVDTEVSALARRIRDAQQPEIDAMESWLRDWGQPIDGGMDGMDHGGMDHGGMQPGGMLTPEQMRQLEQAPVARAQKLYLTGMIAHHRGAIAMARSQLAAGQNPKAVALARDIVRTQSEEIATMRALLPRR